MKAHLLWSSLLLLLAGCFLFLIYAVEWWPSGYSAELGGFCWASAFLLVVLDNYIKKLPVHTRAGLLRFEDSPKKYRLPYLTIAIPALILLMTIAMLILAKIVK